MEIPKRLTPSSDVTRQLYLASGNRCAYPQCDQALMSADAVLVGEIAHIEGALPRSARFNPKSNNEKRREYDNLVLLCATHHTTIDRDIERWSVADLKDLKRKHEEIYTSAVDKLRRQVGDITDGVTYTPAVNGLALIGHLKLDEHERAVCCKDVNRFAERLCSVPVDARSLLALIVTRGDEAGSAGWSGEFQIPVRALKGIADCTAVQLRQHVEVLEYFDMLYRDDEPFDGPPVYIVGNSTPGVGWPLLQEIRNFAAGDQSMIRRILCDLDFSAFDQE